MKTGFGFHVRVAFPTYTDAVGQFDMEVFPYVERLVSSLRVIVGFTGRGGLRGFLLPCCLST